MTTPAREDALGLRSSQERSQIQFAVTVCEEMTGTLEELSQARHENRGQMTGCGPQCEKLLLT